MFRSMSENDKKIVFLQKNCFSSMCSSGQVEGSFGNSAEKLLTKGRSFSVDVECSFDNPAEKFSRKGRKFVCHSRSENDKKNMYSFLYKMFYLKMFLWTRRMQFRRVKSFDEVFVSKKYAFILQKTSLTKLEGEKMSQW